MVPTLRRQNVLLQAIQSGAPLKRRLAWVTAITLVSWASGPLVAAQVTTEIRRTLTVTSTEPLALDVEVPSGDLQILYGREGQVSISGVAKASAGAKLDDNFFPAALTIELS